MKKLTAILLAGIMMTFGLVGCGSTESSTVSTEASVAATQTTTIEEETVAAADTVKPETIVIQSLNAEKELVELEVPYNPQRIAVLDMAALDIIDSLGLGDRVVGSAKVSIEYLTDYNPENSNGAILNLGSVKTADMEQVAISEPDVIFIGGRLSASYDALSEIAPVVYLAVDYEKGVVQSTADNAKTIASMFGKETEIDAMMEGFQARVDALKTVVEGRNVLLGMYNNNAMSILGTDSQLSIIGNEMGGINLGDTVGEVVKPAHGDDASWETIINLNPEYLFVLDRSSAVSSEDGVLGAQEVIENDLMKELDVYKNGNIVYFMKHANVWYTSTGGIQALDTMLTDLEEALRANEG
ncbi:MAG: ABC transporter substrate-binding protein [Lachnospiraceae bacterium]|nr:ABC transporter substrate-binding protein [Lachnospiraceae bacterium]